MASNLSALDRLRKAANLEPIKKEVTLSDGSIFEMYVTPLTMAERERAKNKLEVMMQMLLQATTYLLKLKMKMAKNFLMQEKLMY